MHRHRRKTPTWRSPDLDHRRNSVSTTRTYRRRGETRAQEVATSAADKTVSECMNGEGGAHRHADRHKTNRHTLVSKELSNLGVYVVFVAFVVDTISRGRVGAASWRPTDRTATASICPCSAMRWLAATRDEAVSNLSTQANTAEIDSKWAGLHLQQRIRENWSASKYCRPREERWD